MGRKDRPVQFNLSGGMRVTAKVDIESRVYNGRWYTDIKAWQVNHVSMPNDVKNGQKTDNSKHVDDGVSSKLFDGEIPF